MMRTNLWLPSGLAIVALAAAGAAQAQEDPKALFGARYAALRTAMQAHDAAAVKTMLAPDYQLTDIRGETHDIGGMLELSQRMPADPARKSDTTVLAVNVVGSAASVEQQTTAGMERAGKDGTPHTMELVLLSTDAWVKSGDAWLLKSSVQKELTVKRDGEVFFHQAN